MKKLFALLVCILLVFTLVSCGDDPCQHRDADDNSLCDKCGESYTDGKDLPDEHTHAYTIMNTDSKYLDKAADCENTATYFYSCSCGAKGTETFTSGSANGHSYNEQNTDSEYLATAADCENAATYFYSCSCGEKGTTNFTHGDANGHSYTVKNTDSKYLDKEADCENAATYFYSCSCGAKGTETFTYGEPLVASEGLVFMSFGDGTCYVDDIGTCTDTDIVIPKKSPKGHTVTHIGNRAFYYCDSLTSVTIPNSVTSIGKSAFYYCTSLTSVVIPNSVTSIGERAFYDCYSLTSITVSANNAAYKDIDGNLYTKDGKTLIQYAIGKTATSFTIPDSVTSIGNYAFSNCYSLTSGVIGDSVTNIGDSAFSGCYRLVEIVNNSSLNITAGSNDYGYVAYYAKDVHTGEIKGVTNVDGYLFYTSSNGVHYLVGYIGNDTELTLPDSYNGENYEIKNYAFYDCDSLRSVTIPGSVTSIGEWAFCSCDSLTSVTIGNGITSIGKRAFSYCSGLTSVTIPDSVTSIGNYAFYECDSLTSVVIGDRVTSIGDYAFYYCDSLTSVVIPDSVTRIGDYAFYGCRSLMSIKYRGTEAQWNTISKGYSWNYNTGNYTITYNYKG